MIKTGGKQYLIKEDDVIKVEKIKDKKEGENFEIKEVLLISDEKGKEVKVGQPFVEKAKVIAQVIENGRDKKIRVVKYHPKTRYHKVKGHCQSYMKIKIKEIKLD